MASLYTPPQSILDNYAKVLVNFALNSGRGVKKGEVVRIMASESAKPLYIAIRNQILKSGAYPITTYSPDGTDRDFFDLANDSQLKFFPKKYLRGLVDTIDHSVGIISETNKHELEGIDPKKIMLQQSSRKLLRDWLNIKEDAGKFTWTLGLYGTSAMAAEAGISLKAYWDQIIKACFLDAPDPIAKWHEVSKENSRIRRHLDSLLINKLHVKGPDVDLWITLGKNRRWLGGSGRNIPSFEIFTSPDWRGTNGWIKFNQPLYRYGNLITDIKLEFKDGLVVKSPASKNYSVLKEMLSVSGANKIGEFSLTDKRLSRIDHFMAETLFDENISGPFGNTHIALGDSYSETCTTKASPSLGFNQSVIHTDIISTTDRTVTAILKDGTSKIIYKSGQFIHLT